MKSLENAVTDTLEELEMDDYIEGHIREVDEDTLYHVTFQEIENGNNRAVVEVAYMPSMGDLLNDEEWRGEISVELLERQGSFRRTTAQLLEELLAVTLDPDYYDSDSEEEDSDDETLSLPSEPRTPPVRVLRPLVPRLQLPQRNLP